MYFLPGDHLLRPKGLFAHESIFIGCLVGLTGTWVVENVPDDGVRLARYESFQAGQPVTLVTHAPDQRARSGGARPRSRGAALLSPELQLSGLLQGCAVRGRIEPGARRRAPPRVPGRGRRCGYARREEVDIRPSDGTVSEPGRPVPSQVVSRLV